MKHGRTLVSLVDEVERQREAALDYTGPASLFTARCERSPDLVAPWQVCLEGASQEAAALPLTPYALRQLAQWAEIPAVYVDRMLELQPRLLAINLNAWLERGRKDSRLVRTLDGRVRAWLSGRYRPLDNVGLLHACMPTLGELGALVVSCEVTEQRLYVKAVLHQLHGRVPNSRTPGDSVEAGLMLSNSEVGAGSLRVEPFLRRVVGDAGLVLGDQALRRNHVGSARGELDAVVEAHQASPGQSWEDRGLWARVGEVMREAADPRAFQANLERLGAAAHQELPTASWGRLDVVVEVVAKRAQVPDTVHAGVLKHLTAGENLTRWGVAAAFGRAAADQEDYTLATDLERAAGLVACLSGTEWARLVEKALARR